LNEKSADDEQQQKWQKQQRTTKKKLGEVENFSFATGKYLKNATQLLGSREPSSFKFLVSSYEFLYRLVYLGR